MSGRHRAKVDHTPKVVWALIVVGVSGGAWMVTAEPRYERPVPLVVAAPSQAPISPRLPTVPPPSAPISPDEVPERTPEPVRIEPSTSPTRAPAAEPTYEPEPTSEPTLAPEPEPGPEGVVAAAREYLDDGIPYRWGGKDELGMDCSGFIWNVLTDAGLDVGYRDSRDLRSWTEPVSADEARAGDLVFWPGHVGVYVGDGVMIDMSSGSGTVTRREVWSGATYGRLP